MDPFTARMLERARDRQRRVDERTGAAPAPAAARSPLRTGTVTNSEPSGPRQTEKSASPRRPAEHREDKENHPNALHESTRSRLKQLGSLYSTDGETDLDAYDVDVTPRHSRAVPEPEPPTRPLTSSSSGGLRNRLAGLASQYQELESEEMQGFTPTGSRSRLVYDFSESGRSPSPPRVVSAVTKPPSPEKTGPAPTPAVAPYRSASPVRYSPPPRPQPASPTGVPYSAPAREWSPDCQASPTRQPSPVRQASPTRQPSPVRGRFVQERAAVFDRPASPPPPNVDPTEMTLSDRRKLFEKGQAPKVIARFGTPVTPHMLRQHAATEGPSQPAPPAAGRPRPAAEPTRPRPALEQSRSRSPLRKTAPAAPPSGPPSPSRAVGESTVQAHRKLWESMNNDWKHNEIAQSSRQQREKELGFLANRWQHKPAELEQAAVTARPMEEMAPPAAPCGGIPPPPPPPASPPARRAGGDHSGSPVRQVAPSSSPARHSPVHHSPARHSPVHHSPVHHSPVHHSPVHHSSSRHSPSRRAETVTDGQHSSGERTAAGPSRARRPYQVRVKPGCLYPSLSDLETASSSQTESEAEDARSGSSPASTMYRGSTAADESTISYASGHSDAESLGAEILAMARANQPAPSLPTIDESSADSSSDLSSMAACAAIDDVLDDMDNDQDEPTPPKRTRKTILRRCISHPTASAVTSSNSAITTSDVSVTVPTSTASTSFTACDTLAASATTATTATVPATTATTAATAATATAASPSVAQLIRRFQRPPLRPSVPPHHRRSAPCLGVRRPAACASVACPATIRTSTPRRSMSAVPVPSMDVTAVLPGEGALELSLEAGGDAGSTETLTEGDLADTTSVRRRGVACGSAGVIPTPIRSELISGPANTTLARPDLTFDLANTTSTRPDLTFDLTDPAPVPADLGAVSWTGRSPRCWEEEGELEDHGGDTDGATPGATRSRSRLRQYLFGISSTETAPRQRLDLTDTQSESHSDSTELLGGEDDAPEIKFGAPGTKHGAPEAKPGALWTKLGPVAAELSLGSARGAGEGALEASWSGRPPGQGDVTVSDIVSQLEAVCLGRGGGDGKTVPCAPGHPESPDHPTRGLPPSASRRKQRQESGVFRTPMACVKSPERDHSLPSVVLDGDGAEVPLMHSVSFYRRQKPQEVQVTPVRPVVRNREVPSRYDEPSSSQQQQQQQQQMGASTQERIKHLQKEATQQMNVMSQASRALNLCNATIEFTGSAEMVEAERLLLVATHRRQAALSEIQRLKTEGAMRQQGILRPASRGSLSVSSVTLPVKTSFVREVAAGSANYVYHFVVLLRYRGQVIATQMLSSEDSIKGNAINFPNLVSFRELEAEFCVALEVYGLQAQREVLPHDAKYHIRKDRTKTPKKLLKQQSSLTSPAIQSPAGPGAVRATCFQLMGFIHLTARNLTNNAWTLEKVPSQSPLDGGVLMTVTCHADCAVEERGFITVFDDVSGFGAWHRRWAALSAGRLSFWRYPEDEGRAPPSAEVDLRRCVTERVGPVPRDICARQNTLLLVTVRQARPEDADSLVMQRRGSMTRIRHLLSLDGRDERQLWADKLNETLANIRAWDPDAMQPHLDPSA